jgi:hypothetical protein
MLLRKLHMMKKRKPLKPTWTKQHVGLKVGFRSGLEGRVAEQFDSWGLDCQYEEEKIQYEIPARSATYTPDFRLPSGVYVETKGRFLTADRKKHLLIKEQHPEIEIRFVFSNPQASLSHKSVLHKTTCADWCEKHGFKYASKLIPEGWFRE